MKGLLPILISARSAGFKKFIIPSANALEASYIQGLEIFAVSSLSEAVEFIAGHLQIQAS